MRRRKHIKPEDTVPLRLSPQQHRLLLDEVMVWSELDDRLRLGMAEDEQIALHLTLDELDELAGSIAFAANHEDDRKLQRRLDDVYDLVEKLLNSHTDEPEMAGTSAESPPADDGADALVAEGLVDWDISDEVSAAITAAMVDLKTQFADLSPFEASWLCASDLDDPEGAVRLSEELTLEELQGAPMLLNARILLRALRDEGGTKATVAGNLNRRFVESMLERFHCRPGYVEEVRTYNKVINEEDFWPLHIVRVVLELAGLLRRHGGAFKAIKKREGLLRDDRAGELYALLFRTHFGKFNLAYLDRFPDIEWLQPSIGFSLYAVGVHARTWIKLEELGPLVLHPMARDEVESLSRSYRACWPAEPRILWPLESFGLLERRESPSKPPWEQPSAYRRTGLFDRFLTFDFSGMPTAPWSRGTH